MKKVNLIVLLMVFLSFTQGNCQTTPDKENLTDNNGKAPKMPSQEDIQRFISNGWVRYSDFGAKGDGKTDDIAAIAATHTFANKHNLTVKGDDKATYYIGGRKHTVNIQTDTDFGNAAFIIDDTNVADRNAHVFSVNSAKQSYKLKNVASLKKKSG